MKRFAYEQQIINPILTCIKKHQEYLTQPENLPQLAKLGYMYNTLWYAGRVCWGYRGILERKYTQRIPQLNADLEVLIYSQRGATTETGYSPLFVAFKTEAQDEDLYQLRKKKMDTLEYLIEDLQKYKFHFGQCEDNPKYKIEMCDPKTTEIENLIYDAWGMHVSNENDHSDWDEVMSSRHVYSGLEIALRKQNKSMDEWVECLTDPNYRYASLYREKRSVLNHLLCVIGNGYGYQGGYIIREASGADQDIDLYGFWENAEFPPAIQKVVDKVLANPFIGETLDAAQEQYMKWNAKHADKYPELTSEQIEVLINLRAKFNHEPKYSQYYPISNYSIIGMLDESSHPSYIKAGLEVCEDIMEHENEERPENVEFAKEFIQKFG